MKCLLKSLAVITLDHETLKAFPENQEKKTMIFMFTILFNFVAELLPNTIKESK